MKGMTVAITGASRGIGAAAARLFAERGANVALLARSVDGITEIASEIGDRAMAIACDVSDFGQVESALTAARARFGSLDVLINNAGIIDPIAPMDTVDPESWGALIDVNLKGAFYGVRAALPIMLPQGSGTIITVSSGAAHAPIEGWSSYCASKAGAAMLTRSLHLEMAGRGIRALGLSPGTVATQMQRDIKVSAVDNRVRQLDWSDHIPPEWPAKCLLWMCSDDARDFDGEEISLRNENIRRRVGVPV